jgi:hypothetical protein
MAGWLGEDEEDHRRDVALICLNGHVINPNFRTRPEFNSKFCEACGRGTTNHCESCNAEIPGALPLTAMSKQRYLKAYCGSCGAPYPWTSRALSEARQLALETIELSDDERRSLTESVPSLLSEGPGTPLAIARFKRVVLSGGRKFLAEGLRQILYSVAAESARRQIWGP